MSFFLMARTVLKSLFRMPATRRYPLGPRRQEYKNTRGKITNNISQCIFCGLCQTKCPCSAITVNREEKTWRINRLRCINCGYCAEVCPKKCLKIENQYFEPVFTKSEEVYKNA